MDPRPAILVLESDESVAASVARTLDRLGYGSLLAFEPSQARRLLRERSPIALILDAHLQGSDRGLAFLAEARALRPALPAVVLAGGRSLPAALASPRLEAVDCLALPLHDEDLERALGNVLARAAAPTTPRSSTHPAAGSLVGRSRAMSAVSREIARVADLRGAVLIRGESGTGKDLVARAIHDSGPRHGQAFVAVICTATPKTLFDADMFGFRRGAVAGCTADRSGLFEAADRGTLLLDEISELPLPVQAKLVRVLEAGEIRPLGAWQGKTVNVRVLAATHRDLDPMARAGTFRSDLFDRLSDLVIEVPPLRQRLDDIPLLVEHFLNRAPRRAPLRVDPAVLEAFRAYPWPGNVRELAHMIERVAAISTGGVIRMEDLPARFQKRPPAGNPLPSLRLADVERAHVLQVLSRVNGARNEAARVLGIDRKTLYRKMRSYGVR